ncbi:hypothetical protein [Rhodopila sp.]|uniref:hypothetical protein n=1 Tax=Rhodopila sp. TaxID=2480087 RepID=UPI003D113D89
MSGRAADSFWALLQSGLKTRRHPQQQPALTAAFALRHQLGIEDVVVDHSAAMALAGRTARPTHDASNLWVARLLVAELVTLDRRLATADAASRG